MGLMLDTTVFIATERQRFDLDAFIEAEATSDVVMSTVTASELLVGVELSSPEKRLARGSFVENLIRKYLPIPFDLPSARIHAALVATLRRAGTPLGDHDLIIAATAIAYDHEIVTLDLRSFGHVPGLRCRELRLLK